MRVKNQEKIYREIERLVIADFNFNRWDDIVLLDEMLYKLGIRNEIITVGSRENDFNLEQKLIDRIRENLPQIFADNAGYVMPGDGQKYPSSFALGFLSFYSDINSIIDLWKFYEFFYLFSLPNVNDSPFRFLDTYNLNSFKGPKNMLINKLTHVIVGKNDEDNEIFIDCLKENDYLLNTVRQIVG